MLAFVLCQFIFLGRELGFLFQCFFNHINSLLLVTECRKPTECHIVSPVEPTIVSWVFHTVGPIVSGL